MKLLITDVQNGYRLNWEEDWSDDDIKDIRKEEMVLEDYENDENGCMKRMLIAVADRFGYNYNKFGRENLEINFNKKGHKLD